MKLPHDITAERAVLGCAMLSARALDEMAATLTPSDFCEPRHRKAFESMCALASSSKMVDEVTVASTMGVEGSFAYLSELVSKTPLGEEIGSYIAVLRDKSARRAIIEAAREATEMAMGSSESPGTIADKAAAVMSQATSGQSEEFAEDIQTLLRRESKRMELAREGKGPKGLSTGFIDLDETLGGMHAANLIIVAGRPGMGKTAFASAIANSAAEHGAKTLFFSLEMSSSEVTQRMVASAARANLNRIRTGHLHREEWSKVGNANARLYALTFGVSTVADLSIVKLRSYARRWKAKNGGLDLVLVDYLQLMSGDDRNGREREVAAISRGLKALAMELQIPVIALSQLSRRCEERAVKKPQLSDLRESGAVEQDADAVLFVYRDDYYTGDKSQDPGVTEIIIGKNRNGAAGGSVKLRWSGESTRFDNLARAS